MTDEPAATYYLVPTASNILTVLVVHVMSLVTTQNADNLPYCIDKENKKPYQTAWKCDQKEGKCTRVRVKDETNVTCLTSLNICNLLCDSYGSLWPLPTKNIKLGRSLLPVDAEKAEFVTSGISNEKLLKKFDALHKYFKTVIGYNPPKRKNLIQVPVMEIRFKLKDENVTSLTYDTLENYHLKFEKSESLLVDVIIEADNYFGARHGIETLLQLIVLDEISNLLYISSAFDIEDEPVFRHRGVMLDTSRNYYPVGAIKRLLDGMAYNKLNVFHWHMTDSQSFPYESKQYPQMSAFGAYSTTKTYSRSNIGDIVEYASVRGIKVVPEIDVPAHVGEGWQYFEEDILLCFKDTFCRQIPCGILNPINDRVYEILRHLYSEFFQLFDTDVFHSGGDEIVFECWDKTPSILKWLSDRNLDRSTANFLNLWGTFHNRSVDELYSTIKEDRKPKIIFWTSLLTESESRTFLDPNRTIIQVWTRGDDTQTATLLKNGYEIIMSNHEALYLDCGFGDALSEGNNWCSPYHSWQKVYMNDIKNMIQHMTQEDFSSQILGAEVTLWSELSNEDTLDTRVWPRAAALAERLWSNPTTNWRKADGRMMSQRERMAARNIAPDVVAPLYCHHNTDMCLFE